MGTLLGFTLRAIPPEVCEIVWAFPLCATGVAVVFGGYVARDWRERRRPHLIAWTVALAMFALASLAVALGLLLGWSADLYRAFYLFGAILNVPVLGLGTIYLLGPRPLGHVSAVLVLISVAFAGLVVINADLHIDALAVAGIPAGRDVMPSAARAASRYYSFSGFFVVVGGALLSAWRMSRGGDDHLRPLAIANLLIAVGTFVVALASGFARYGEGAVFAAGLAAGITIMFAGFLKTRPRSAQPVRG